MTTKPPFQALLSNITLIIGGLTGLGQVLDAIVNAKDLITLPIAVISTFIIVTIYFVLLVLFKKGKIKWQSKEGHLLTVRKFGIAILWRALGGILLLWIPFFLPLNKPSPKLMKYVELELYQNTIPETLNPTGPHDARTIGDLKITLEYTGKSYNPISYQQWQPGSKPGTFNYFLITLPPGTVYPAKNELNIRVPNGTLGWTFSESVQYVLGLIDFAALIGGENIRSLPFQTLLIRSKSSATKTYADESFSESFKQQNEYEIKFSIFSETLIERRDSDSTVIAHNFDVMRLRNILNNTSINVKENKLATLIIEARESINAIFYDKHKAKLLLLNDERNLLDFFKKANTEEEFSHRLASLAQVSQRLNVDILRSVTQEANREIKSIELLDKFLSKIGVQSSEITGPLKKINRIRQGYPIHTDTTGNVAALRDLGISYPINDYEAAWQTLLKSYYSALDKLRQILNEKYSKE